MRVILGIAIALPIAAAFCLAFLTMLALEAWHDATLSPHGVSTQRAAWIGPARVAT